VRAGFGPIAVLLPPRTSRLKDRSAMAEITTSENAEIRPFATFAGYSVAELLRTALGCVAYCDRKDAEFLERLAVAQPTELPLAELKWLVGICRHVACKPLPRFHLSISEAGETISASRLAVLTLHSARLPQISPAIKYPRRRRTARTALDREPAPAARDGGRRGR
jgi:hypothetical protein